MLSNLFSIAADISIWAREAGPGSLSVTMEGPGRAELVFEDREDGSCGISYTATEPGINMNRWNPCAVRLVNKCIYSSQIISVTGMYNFHSTNYDQINTLFLYHEFH